MLQRILTLLGIHVKLGYLSRHLRHGYCSKIIRLILFWKNIFKNGGLLLKCVDRFRWKNSSDTTTELNAAPISLYRNVEGQVFALAYAGWQDSKRCEISAIELCIRNVEWFKYKTLTLDISQMHGGNLGRTIHLQWANTKI